MCTLPLVGAHIKSWLKWPLAAPHEAGLPITGGWAVLKSYRVRPYGRTESSTSIETASAALAAAFWIIGQGDAGTNSMLRVIL
jgi:hypothetical protein